MIAPRRRLPLAAAIVALAAPLLAHAQAQPTLLSPAEPKDGASVGKKPRFVIRAATSDVEKLRFRIEMSKDEFKTVAYTFDQLKDANGWAYTVLDDQTPGAAYFTHEVLAGGDYKWRVSSWDGLSWLPSADEYRLQIDDVPPADVEGVTMTRDASAGCVRLRWAPVTTDRDGGAERVAVYHVYRYASKGPIHPVRPFEAGTSNTLEFSDCDKNELKKPILFYRVVAEDEAGNIAGRRF